MNPKPPATEAARPGPIVRYLTETPPAKLIIHSAIVLLVFPFLTAMSLDMQTGMGFAESLESTWSPGGQAIYSGGNESGNPLRTIFVWWIVFLARVLSVIGVILPIWACTRLIADALRAHPANANRPG